MSTLVPLPTPPPDPPVGEYIPRERAEVDRALAGVRLLAKLLDSVFTIPGTKFRVGLDPLLGLIPVGGDLVGMLVSGYILAVAARLGVSKAVLARMLLNVGADAVAGSVPVVGDVFDAAWRANSKNAALLEQAVADPRGTGRSSGWVVAGVVAAVVAITAGGLALAVVLANALWGAVG
jgi:hypothetical protein